MYMYVCGTIYNFEVAIAYNPFALISHTLQKPFVFVVALFIGQRIISQSI